MTSSNNKLLLLHTSPPMTPEISDTAVGTYMKLLKELLKKNPITLSGLGTPQTLTSLLSSTVSLLDLSMKTVKMEKHM